MLFTHRDFCVADRMRCPPTMWLFELHATDSSSNDDDKGDSTNPPSTPKVTYDNYYLKIIIRNDIQQKLEIGNA